jgi:hypothetical protein
VLLLPLSGGGRRISDRLSQSPVRPDYLISAATERSRARRIVSEDFSAEAASLQQSLSC